MREIQDQMIRRLPGETREELIARFRQIVNDPMVDVVAGSGPQLPATDPSPLTTPLYRAIERVILGVHPEDVVIPYMSRGATDGSFLRARGIAVIVSIRRPVTCISPTRRARFPSSPSSAVYSIRE